MNTADLLAPLEPQSRAFAENALNSGMPPPWQQTVAKSRAGMMAMAVLLSGPRVDVHRVADRMIPGPGGPLLLRIYTPRPVSAGERLGALLYLHGGGFYLGSVDSHDNLCRNLCSRAGLLVVSVDYRRAPEHKFPAAVEDCHAALCWLAGHADELGIDAGRIAVAGDSSGGTLTISTCLKARDGGGPAIAFQVVVYGLLTLEDALDMPSRARYGGGEFLGSVKDLEFVRNLYLTDAEKEMKNPLASPLLAGDFSRLPPALVVAAGCDMVRDDNSTYADRLREAGVAVEYKCYEDTLHPFFLFSGLLDVGKEAQDLVAGRLRAALA